MSTIELKAKPGCEDQINAAFSSMTGIENDWIVYSRKTIEFDIEYVHSEKADKSQWHMRAWLHTIDDWNNAFPSCSIGAGTISLFYADDDEKEIINDIKQKIKFVLNHRMLFTSASGFDYARESGFTDFSGDIIENGRTTNREIEVRKSFTELPSGKTDFYKRCVEYNRPDIWEAYCNFGCIPSNENWLTLRSLVIPWSPTGDSIWPLVEGLAMKQDGKDPGIKGRFSGGKVPSLMLVRQAVK